MTFLHSANAFVRISALLIVVAQRPYTESMGRPQLGQNTYIRHTLVHVVNVERLENEEASV